MTYAAAIESPGLGHPSGWRGHLTAHFMAWTSPKSHGQVLDRLDLKANHRVLEVGFGPGVDLQRLLAATPKGLVAGVDPSELMLEHAIGRNERAICERRLDLYVASACALPLEDAAFDRVLSIDSAPFWENLDAGVRELFRVLRPNGRAVIAVQPKRCIPGDGSAESWSERLVAAMTAAGFADVTAELLPSGHDQIVTVVGTAPDSASNEEARETRRDELARGRVELGLGNGDRPSRPQQLG